MDKKKFNGYPMEKKSYSVPMVRVLLQPEEKRIELPRHKVKTVLRLLDALAIRPGTAIVARGSELLTPDRLTEPGDELLVRKVTSAG